MFSQNVLQNILQDPNSDFYHILEKQAQALFMDEPNWLANAANLCALLYHTMPDINWCGFYFLQDSQLVLGPFQGLPACVRIPIGKGVCGTAVKDQATIIVEDVHLFPGHIACDAASNSELVIPIWHQDRLIGVFDVDSPKKARFSPRDSQGIGLLLELWSKSSVDIPF
jgi:GAF domain-containing protein